MARYIDAELLVKEIAKIEDLRTLSTKTIGEAIDRTPTADVVEVVRCRDCGSYNTHYGECTLNGSHYGENGYCYKGKRTPQKEEAVEDRTEESFSLIQTAMKRSGEK